MKCSYLSANAGSPISAKYRTGNPPCSRWGLRQSPRAMRRLGDVPCIAHAYTVRNGLLDESVKHRRYTQQTNAPVRFRYLHAPHRLRFTGPRPQSLAQFQPMLFQVRWQHIDGHPVNARRAFVLAYLLQGALQIRALHHPFEQRVVRNRLGCIRLSSDRFITRGRRVQRVLIVRSLFVRPLHHG